MEAKKTEKKQQPPKLSYAELAKKFGELFQNYQELSNRYTQALDALNQRDFEYTSFFLTTLFRVMDHSEQYKPEFVDWVKANIESMLVTFANTAEETRQQMEAQEKQEKKEETKEPNEAE